MTRTSTSRTIGSTVAVLCGASVILTVAAGRAPVAAACEALTAVTMPGVTIASAEAVPAGTLTLGRPLAVPAFCRVRATASPSPDSNINVEVWLPPAAAWNGKLLGTDNGGFSGAIDYPDLASAVSRGYAAVGTDTGHTGDQMDFGVGHPERIVDWAYRAVHVMTEIAKVVVRDHFGRLPERAYFSGCSTGGQQALSEVQRFPGDYDGVVAGNPGNNRLNLIYGFLWSWLAAHAPDGSQTLPSAKLPALAHAAVAACDGSDGLEDGIIDDPSACRFDPGAIACTGVETDSCLTPPQVEAVRKIYAGATNPRTGERIYPGWARGSEAGWRTYITEPKEPVRVGLFRGWAFRDPQWDPRTFDFDRDVTFINERLSFLSATSTDLSAYRARGGRIIMYTGLADPVVPPGDTVEYYDRVADAMGGLAQTRTFFRFFPVPGMAHCGGGVGPNRFDALAALEDWVERGVAPDSLLASHADGRTRPVCAYPARARYRGTGSPADATSFTCVSPD